MNGVLNFSVLDGWWYEGYKKGAGWALTDKRTYENQAHQDQLDAATIYQILEQEIIPMYYARNSKGYSPDWIQTIKNSVTQITPLFTTKRMMDDYFERFYNKEAKRHSALVQKNYEKARQIVAWKQNIAAHWDSIEVLNVDIPDTLVNGTPEVGEAYKCQVTIDTKQLNDKGIGIELVAVKPNDRNEDELSFVQELKLVNTYESVMVFETSLVLNYAGAHKFAFRMFPKNALLPHRQDFCFVRWI